MIVMVSQYGDEDDLQIIAYGNPDEMRADFLTMAALEEDERIRVFEAVSFGEEFTEVFGRRYNHCIGVWGSKKSKKKRKRLN
jgi:hypothetical protein